MTNTEQQDNAINYDAESLAKMCDITVDKAIEHLKLQDVASGLEAKFIKNESDTFAGLWIEHGKEFRVVVLFTKKGCDDVKKYLPDELVDITEVRCTAQKTLLEFQDMQNELISLFKEIGVPADSAIDVYENCVIMELVDIDTFDKAAQEGRITLSEYVKIIPVKSLATFQTDIYGGLSAADSTFGFIVEDDDGNRGITNAGHVDNNDQTYAGYNLSFVEGKVYTHYDIQWYSIPNGLTSTNQIKWSPGGSTRYIYSTRSRDDQSVGDYVCKFGKTTGYTGGYLGSKNALFSEVLLCYPTFMRVDWAGDTLVQGGDSGGPWFIQNVALGTTSGGTLNGDAIYMAVNYFYGIHVTVVTR